MKTLKDKKTRRRLHNKGYRKLTKWICQQKQGQQEHNQTQWLKIVNKHLNINFNRPLERSLLSIAWTKVVNVINSWWHNPSFQNWLYLKSALQSLIKFQINSTGWWLNATTWVIVEWCRFLKFQMRNSSWNKMVSWCNHPKVMTYQALVWWRLLSRLLTSILNQSKVSRM